MKKAILLIGVAIFIGWLLSKFGDYTSITSDRIEQNLVRQAKLLESATAPRKTTTH